MNELMRRRRALMGAKEKITPIYSLYNHAVTAGNRITTGKAIFAEDVSTTVLFDFDMTSNPTTGYGRVWILMIVWHSGINANALSIQKTAAAAVTLSGYYMSSNATSLTSSKTSAGRHRISVTHEANSNTIYVKYKYGTGTTYSYTITGTYSATTGKLNFGRVENGDNSLPSGTINKAEVYDVVLDSATIDAFFA